jgi:beta-glucosidase
VVAAFGYELGIFPPGLRDIGRKELATTTLIAAHREAVAAIRRAAPGVKVGLALSMNEWGVLPGSEQRMLELRRSMEDVYLEATQGDDFIGVQNYTRLHVGPGGIVGPPPGSRVTQIGFEFRPEALGVTVRRAAEVTGLPVMVTENGISTLDDQERIEYTRQALHAVEVCLAGGVNVLGYIHWSALDSFEWVLGYWPKYGLIEVDHASQVRTPRASGRWLGRVARANSVVAA